MYKDLDVDPEFFTITLLHQIAIKYEDYYHGVLYNNAAPPDSYKI